MDVGTTLTLFFGLIAVIGIPLSIWATWRWGARRGLIRFDYNVTPLIPIKQQAGDDGPPLKVTYRNYEVPEPCLVKVRLINEGPHDIASARFDGKSATIRLNCTAYGPIRSTHPDVTQWPGVGDQDAVIELTPTLLKRNETWEAVIVVSGRPDPELDVALVDADVIRESDLEKVRRQSRMRGRVLGTINVAVIVLASIGFYWALSDLS